MAGARKEINLETRTGGLDCTSHTYILPSRFPKQHQIERKWDDGYTAIMVTQHMIMHVYIMKELTYCYCFVMEITWKLDEPNITLGNRIFLKDVDCTLNKNHYASCKLSCHPRVRYKNHKIKFQGFIPTSPGDCSFIFGSQSTSSLSTLCTHRTNYQNW